MVDKTKFLFITFSSWTSGWHFVFTKPDGTIRDNVYTLVEEGSKAGVTVTGGTPGGNIEIGGKKFVKVGGIIPATGTPEPATWLTMLIGFGFIGATMRSVHRKRVKYA
jgi:hypothetical protein